MQRIGFEEHLQAMLPDLFSCAYALTGQRADAEDLVHDACVKALTQLESLNDESHGASRAWVRAILVNLFRDRYRRERKAPIMTFMRSEDQQMAIESATEVEPNPEQATCQSLFERDVERAVVKLPVELRVVFVLHTVSELTYQEIAKATESPIGTVMSRLFRGRRLLRTALRHYEPPVSCVSKPVPDRCS